MAYLNIPETYWDDETLNNDERVMLSIVHSYQGSCYWSISKWCEKFRQSKPTILGLIRSLEERGYLEAIRVNGKSTTYRILDETGKKSLPVKKLDRTGKETLLVPVKNFDHTGKESLPYIYKYNNNDKESYSNSIVADAPLPTEPLLKDSLIDLDSVKEPLETLEEPETSDLTQPPRDSPPPLPKKKKTPSRNTSFPSPEYWASVKPNLLSWMRDHGAEGSDEVLLPWIDERLEKLEGAALSKNLKFAAWDRTFMTWYRHLIPDKYKRGFDWFVRNAVDQPRFLEVWKKKKDLEAFGYSDEAIEGYRKTLLNFDEDSPWGGSKIKHFRKTVQKGA
jgi:hypothetical protein